MKITCDLAQGDKFNRIRCTEGDNTPLCKYQRYCSLTSEWQNTDEASQCERRANMSRKSKRHDNDLTFAEPVVFEEIPIEEAPVAIEEAKEEDIEKDNTFQEKLAEVFKAPQKSKRQGKVIFITRNGCVVEGLKGCKGNVRLFGAEFTQCEVGSVIEFD